MKVDILKHRKSQNTKGKSFESYMVFLNDKFIWINQSDFEKQKDLLNVEFYDKPKNDLILNALRTVFGKIDLKEPLNLYYEIVEKTTQKGKFNVLKPIRNNKSNNILKEPNATYTKKNKKNYKLIIEELLAQKLKSGKTVKEILINGEKLNLAELDSEWINLNYELFGDIKFHNEFEKKRKELIAEKEKDADNSKQEESDTSNPFGNIVTPTKEELEAIDIEDIKELLDNQQMDSNNIPDFADPGEYETQLPPEKIIDNNQPLKKTTQIERVKFIRNLMDFATQKKLPDDARLKLVNLMEKELRQNLPGEDNSKKLEELEKMILEMKENLNKNIAKKNNSNKNKKSNYNYKKKHKPIDTTEFLKKFKRGKHALKRLVHSPTDSNYNFESYLHDLQEAQTFFEEQKKHNYLPYGLEINVEELLRLMHNEGKKCFEKTQKHPYLNTKCAPVQNVNNLYKSLYFNYSSKYITYLIQGFKKNYRFSTEKTESYQLKDLTINVFNKAEYPKKEKIYEFNPKWKKKQSDNNILIKTSFSENFNDYAVFFTWVPNVRSFLKETALDILKHGNIKGKQEYESYQKEVIFSIDRKNDEITGRTKIIFSIFDKDSVILKDKEIFYKEINDKKDHLKSLADWHIEADFKEGPYKISILPETTDFYEKLPKKVGGLKHILTFYDV